MKLLSLLHLLTAKPNCGLIHPDFVPNEVLNIIDTVTPMEPALDKAKRIDDACRLFNLMKTRGCSADFVTYNVLLNGFCKLGRVDEALALLKSFRSECYVVGLERYSCLIDGLVRAKRISEAHSLFQKL
nr:pentatricopeptide repeat-containing protein At1g79540 [Ipomoea batatas]GMC66608.1 pentatricopeptide repeat-containing protein At1g79540 [Ipomoea batatas]